MYKPHYGNQDVFPFPNGVWFVVNINKTPLRNGNSPITDPITETNIAHMPLSSDLSAPKSRPPT